MTGILIIVAYIVLLVFLAGALFRAFRTALGLKQRDLLALIGLILMTLIYGATLLLLVVALLSPGRFNGFSALYVWLFVIFIFSMIYHWTSPTFPLRRNRPVLIFMGIVTSISVVMYAVLFFLFLER